MEPRLDYLGSPMVLKIVKHVNAAGAVLHDSSPRGCDAGSW